MRSKPLVVISLLGPTLDAGKGPNRWDRWRPTVAMCQHQDLLISRLELLHQPAFSALAETVKKDIREVSPETQVNQHPFLVKDPWDLEEVYGALHDFARAYPFNEDKEDYLVHITTGTHIAQICMFLLVESKYFPARLLQTSPAKKDPRDKGPGSFTFIDLDLSRYDRLAKRFKAERRDAVSVLKNGIETRNAAFNQLMDRMEKVANASTAPILLMGPTGAGKSQLARRIFELKKARRQVAGEFVDVNCATITGDGAMSTLFGHVKGAFTGSTGDRPGLLKKAHGGVLFLDEIGELGLDEQAMLLRAVEEKVFLPLGSDKEVRSEFQLIAGTNRDLHTRVAQGAFREDLLARINLWTFQLPGLKDRPEDVEPNLDFELRRVSDVLGTHTTMAREARELFLKFARSAAALWSGNFRDLNAAVTRMATLASGGRIAVEDVEEERARLLGAWRPAVVSEPDDPVTRVLGAAKAEELDRFDRVQLGDVLRVCAASKSLSDAGRELFAVSRTKKASSNDADRLRKYLARFGLEWSDVQQR